MKDSRTVPVRELISGACPAISRLAAVAKEIKVFNRLVESALNEPLRSHAKVANVDGDRLVIQCDSPVWSARARLLVPRLLKTVNRDLARSPIKHVQIITRPEQPGGNPPSPRRAQISEHTRKLLENVAAGIENPGLRRTLSRLAKRKP